MSAAPPGVAMMRIAVGRIRELDKRCRYCDKLIAQPELGLHDSATCPFCGKSNPVGYDAIVWLPPAQTLRHVRILSDYVSRDWKVGAGMVAPPRPGDFVIIGQSIHDENLWFVLGRFIPDAAAVPAFREHDWKVVSEKGGKIHVNDSFSREGIKDASGVPTGHVTVLGDRVLLAGGTGFLAFGLSDKDDDWPSGVTKPNTGEILIVHDSGTKILVKADGAIEIDAKDKEINLNQGSYGVARKDDAIKTDVVQSTCPLGIPFPHDHGGKITGCSSKVKAGD